MQRDKVNFVGDVMKYGPGRALSYLNSRLKNDKTISNYLSNKKFNGLASIAKNLGYGKRKRRRGKGIFDAFKQLGNLRNWSIVGSIGKDVLTKIMGPVIAGKIPSPVDALNIVKNGVNMVNGKGRRRSDKGSRRSDKRSAGSRRRKIGGCRCGGRKIRIDTPYNKGLLN